MPLTVEIWSDVVCPWCYIGKRRFEAALERFEHRDDVTIMWRSFELDPEAPADPAAPRPGAPPPPRRLRDRAPGRQVRDERRARRAATRRDDGPGGRRGPG